MVLPELNEMEGRHHGFKHNAVLTRDQKAPSPHHNLQPAANEGLSHAERLGDQAAAQVAIQGQPERILLWKCETEIKRENQWGREDSEKR